MPKSKQRQIVVGDKRIVVGVSGGVDSAMALVLLKNQGWNPTGVFLKFTNAGRQACRNTQIKIKDGIQLVFF